MKYMFASTAETIAAEWEKYKGYTIRPLPSTLSYYEDLLAFGSRKTRFMIYGGTPELRSVFQKRDYPVTLVDRSPEMVQAMGLLTRNQTFFSGNENYIQTDWLNLGCLRQKFDILIGDDAINMVSWPQFKQFLQQAWLSLRPGGLFICHLLVKPSDYWIQQELSQLEEEFKKGVIKSRYDLASRLNFICWDKQSYAMGWQRTINKLGKKNLYRFRPELDFIETFGLCNSHFYCPPIYLFENLVEQFFSVREIFYPHEHEYCLYEPVYVLEKNKEII